MAWVTVDRLITVLCLLVTAHCDVTGVDVTSPTIPTLFTVELNKSRDSLVLLGPTKGLGLTMEKESRIDLLFNILCESEGSEVLSFISKQKSIFIVKQPYTFQTQCPPTVENESPSTAEYEPRGIPLAINLTEAMSYSNVTVTLTLRGGKLGVGDLHVSLWPSIDAFQQSQAESLDSASAPPSRPATQGPLAEQVIAVTVYRPMRPLDRVFLAVVPGFIVLVMIGFGCKLELEVVRECVKRPLAPGLGFLCQYLGMPLVGRHPHHH